MQRAALPIMHPSPKQGLRTREELTGGTPAFRGPRLGWDPGVELPPPHMSADLTAVRITGHGMFWFETGGSSERRNEDAKREAPLFE